MRGAPMKLALIGSRDYPALDLVRRFIVDLPADTVVVSGGARGVDSAAEDAARAVGLRVLVLEPDWETLGRRAGLVRNEEVVDEVDEVVAWWDGESRGTVHALQLAVEAGKPITVFGPRGEKIEDGPWSL